MKTFSKKQLSPEKLAMLIHSAREGEIDFVLDCDGTLFQFIGKCVLRVDGEDVYAYPNGIKEKVNFNTN